MKNVTKILTAVTLCAALFASDQRIKALGGNAAFWPGDEANIAAFPAQVNNHSFLQIDGVGTSDDTDDGNVNPTTDDGGVSILLNKDGTAWGFNYGSGDWVNMSWGNGDMGVTVGMESTAGATSADDKSAMSVAWGGSFDGIGEFGIKYNTNNDISGVSQDANLAVNWRKDCGFWIFDNSVVSIPDLMADDLALSADLFSHHDAGGADVLFAWGVDYNGASSTAPVAGVAAVGNTSTWDGSACTEGGTGDAAGCDNSVAAVTEVEVADVVTISQTATIGVEANMTDWATLRAGYTWNHSLSCDNGTVGDNSCGDNGGGGLVWGLGFNWGGLTADMSVTSGLFQDPIGAVTGYDDGGITESKVTLTYRF